MQNIPPELYERVHEFAIAITNATESGDDVLRASLYHSLRSFLDVELQTGRPHPFLTETVADFTDDPADAVQLYLLSLDQSRLFPNEPTHTKMISLAERLLALSQREQAEAFLRDGRAEAERRKDSFWIEHADTLLQEAS